MAHCWCMAWTHLVASSFHGVQIPRLLSSSSYSSLRLLISIRLVMSSANEEEEEEAKTIDYKRRKQRATRNTIFANPFLSPPCITSCMTSSPRLYIRALYVKGVY